MSKPVKNLVSSSGECHQTNALTGFADSFTAQAQRIRALGARSASATTHSPPKSSAATKLESERNISQFYDMHHVPQPIIHPGGSSTWVDEFGSQKGSLAGPQMIARHPPPMINQFAPIAFMHPGPMMAPVYTPQAPISSSIDSAVRSETSSAPVSVNDDLSAAKRMVEMLRNSGNPKFANSTFVDFIDQVTTGDLRFEDGAVVDREGKPVDWDEVYGEDQEAVDGGLGDILASAGDDVENFPDQMERIWNELRNDNSFLQPEEYQFQHTSNKYIDAESPLEIAIGLLKEGRDADAMIALEAEVRQNPDSSEGWRLLGQLLAQFDRDVDAIKCLDKGHACDSFNLDSMMALGVSLTNELDSIRAMEILKSWIRSNEKYHQLVSNRGNESGVPDYDFIQIKKEVIDLFNQAAKIDPNDFDVAVALGVLHNINREYSLAITSLVNAVQLRPNDFTAWNKLGATLANSGLPRDALLSYHQALALKPNYARAWSNLAIAHSNLDDYENAVRFFLAALQLSPDANHLWSSLVLALSNWKPTDESLSDMLEQKDLSALLNYVDGAPRIEQLPAPRQPAANTVSEILNQVMQTVNRT